MWYYRVIGNEAIPSNDQNNVNVRNYRSLNNEQHPYHIAKYKRLYMTNCRKMQLFIFK